VALAVYRCENWSELQRRHDAFGNGPTKAVGKIDPLMAENWLIHRPEGSLTVRHLSPAELVAAQKRVSGWNIDDHNLVLDLACGLGRYTAHLVKVSQTVVAIDLDITTLELARKLAPQAHFVVCDIRHLPFRQATFDLIWAMESLSYVNDFVVVPNIAALLRPAGLLCVDELAVGDTLNRVLVMWWKQRNLKFLFEGVHWAFRTVLEPFASAVPGLFSHIKWKWLARRNGLEAVEFRYRDHPTRWGFPFCVGVKLRKKAR
jgi:SAM-dependent methyltransferase